MKTKNNNGIVFILLGAADGAVSGEAFPEA